MQLIKLRSFAFDALFALWTASFAFGVPFFWIAGSPQRPIRSATRLWVRGTLFVLRQVVGLNDAERGRENVPTEPCIIISNHQSTWETLAFLVLFSGVAIGAK